jgi:hypothetical protein
MKNLKPSQLPEGTVIATPYFKDVSLYIKKADGIWEDLFSGCGCCRESERISDVGCEEDEDDLNLNCLPHYLTTSKTSDDYFDHGYKLISSHPDFDFNSVMLHGPWVDEYGTFLDGTKMHDCKGYNCEE